jgi:uncharacterized protein YcaQ
VHILSPFDPLIIQRKRTELFFDYGHRFEAYVPKEKRQFGYFALPVLVGDRIVAALGAPAARELLEALEQSDADRAALIGRLYARDDARWIAELLMDLEDEVDEIARLRLIDELRRTLGDGEGRNDWA